jgi:hypothetical protein
MSEKRPGCPAAAAILSLTLVMAAAGAPAAEKTASGRAVFVNAARLPDAQVRELEGRHRIHIQDGRYWYDRVSGAWGIEGGPALGIVPAGMKLGGALRADASGGGYGRLTAVFVNGRELHPRDVAALRTFTTVVPGRYWVDAQGNGGHEGGPAQFNLYQLSQQAARSRGGGSSWYYGNSYTSTYGGSSGGCTYVMGSTAGSGSWSASSGC